LAGRLAGRRLAGDAVSANWPRLSRTGFSGRISGCADAAVDARRLAAVRSAVRESRYDAAVFVPY